MTKHDLEAIRSRVQHTFDNLRRIVALSARLDDALQRIPKLRPTTPPWTVAEDAKINAILDRDDWLDEECKLGLTTQGQVERLTDLVTDAEALLVSMRESAADN
jgi:hypothetical protein